MEIEIAGVSKTYPKGVRALRRIDLTVKKGERFALLGPNGAGKSTLVRILCGLSPRDEGTVRVAGHDPARLHRDFPRLVGVASQENDLDPDLSVQGHLVFQGRLFGAHRNDARRRASELVADFRLESEANKKASALSGGNRRRLHVALAMVHQPHLLFLDEPTVGMDPVARAEFWETLRNINAERDLTILLTTQYLEEADRHTRTMALLLEGEIAWRGSVDAFKKETHPDPGAGLEEAFLAYLTDRGQGPRDKDKEGNHG